MRARDSFSIRMRRFILCLFFGCASVSYAQEHLSPSVTQLVVGIAPSWESMHGRLFRLERTTSGWNQVGTPIPVLFGRNGLAWGRGLLSGNGTRKVERDNKAPAGVFKIGTIYTYDRELPAGSDFPFHTVGAGDAWVDDARSSQYNQHVEVDPNNPPSWFQKQKMRHNDFAYRWLVEIRHNADPAVPGFGSAIFFHIRRGPDRPSAGCTTMPEPNLVELIRWLRSGANPAYVCLPRSEYLARWKQWELPDPAVIGL
jgi:L,D-peptidoglycan transpeptidase YkuD (ErfK/YbiS/YcfS/YnhG family)